MKNIFKCAALFCAFSANANSLHCPEGFFLVEGGSTVGLGSVMNTEGVAPFCVAKYEMKCESDASGLGCSQDDTPLSQAQNKPWTKVTRDDAANACAKLSSDELTGKLISNSQWMIIARDIESQPENWNSGIVGVGMLAVGHSDDISSYDKALAASSDDNPYAGTKNSENQGPRKGWEQKRTHVLSSGDVIWDLGGNVLEWVSDEKLSIGYNDLVPGTSLDSSKLSDEDRLLLGSVNPSLNRKNGVGVISLDQDDEVGILRGGGWEFGLHAGIYGANIGNISNKVNEYHGFRCILEK